jgi:hypothetical protein
VPSGASRSSSGLSLKSLVQVLEIADLQAKNQMLELIGSLGKSRACKVLPKLYY